MSRLPGLVPVALVVASVGSLAVGAIAGLSLARCAPTPYPRLPVETLPPAVVSGAIASSSATVVASQSVRVTIRRPAGYNGSNNTPHASPAPRGEAHLRGFLLPTPGPDNPPEEIVVEVTQGTVATTEGSAAASASVTNPSETPNSSPTHGRLSLLALTAPGGVAVGLQLWRAELPLEVSLDVEANIEQAGAGVAVGNQVYATAGGWARWSLREAGWYLGAGVRL